LPGGRARQEKGGCPILGRYHPRNLMRAPTVTSPIRGVSSSSQTRRNHPRSQTLCQARQRRRRRSRSWAGENRSPGPRSAPRLVPDGVIAHPCIPTPRAYFPGRFSSGRSNRSPNARSICAPSPCQTAPCIHARVEGWVAANRWIIAAAFLVCE